MSRGNITQRGECSWRVTVSAGTDPETGQRRTIRRTVRGSKAGAERALTEILRDVDRGIVADPRAMTLGQYLGEWLADARTRLEVTTGDRYARTLRLHVLPSLGRVRLADLRPLHIQSLSSRLLETGRADGKGGLGAPTVRDVLLMLSTALAQAVRWQLLATNPAALVRRPRVERTSFHVIDPEMARAILAAAAGSDVEAAVTIGLGTGLRRGEVLGLRWQDLDLDGAVLHVRQTLKVSGSRYFIGAPKTKRSVREVPLPAFVAETLRRHHATQAARRLKVGPDWQDLDLVVERGDGGLRSPHGLTEAFQRRLRRAGLPRVRFHDLRHGYATLMLAGGEDLKVVSDLLGHAGIAITADIYASVLPRAKNEAAARLDRVLRGGA